MTAGFGHRTVIRELPIVHAGPEAGTAVDQLQVIGERAGIHVFAPEPGNATSRSDDTNETRGDPVNVARQSPTELHSLWGKILRARALRTSACSAQDDCLTIR